MAVSFNKRARKILGSILMIGLVSTCAPARNVLPNATAEADILRQSARFSEAFVTNDDEALMDIYAHGAVIAPPQQAFIADRRQLRAYWTSEFGRSVVAHKATPENITANADLAYDWGFYEGVSEVDGSRKKFGGKYLIVWTRGDDGVWRMVQDMWN